MSEIRITAKDCPRAPIDKFVPYANNARTHSPEQIKRLQAAYRRLGFAEPIEVDENFTILPVMVGGKPQKSKGLRNCRM